MRHLLGISELKLGVDNGILRHGYCHMYLLMWVDSHNQISGWYLTELMCCATFHPMAPPMLDISVVSHTPLF